MLMMDYSTHYTLYVCVYKGQLKAAFSSLGTLVPLQLSPHPISLSRPRCQVNSIVISKNTKTSSVFETLRGQRNSTPALCYSLKYNKNTKLNQKNELAQIKQIYFYLCMYTRIILAYLVTYFSLTYLLYSYSTALSTSTNLIG